MDLDIEKQDTVITEKYIKELEVLRAKNPKYISRGITSLSLCNYASKRIKESDSQTKWPPRMMEIIDYVSNVYEKRIIVTELTLVMIELCLNVPIQWNFVIDGHVLDLNKEGFIVYRDKSFDEAITVVMDLLDRGFLTYDELRIDRKIIDEIRERAP